MGIKATLFRTAFNFGMKVQWRSRKAPHIACQDVVVPVSDGSIKLRVYTPPSSEGPLPTLIYYHGGGWVIGNVDSYDKCCRDLCDKSGYMVISVDYRLAPEHPFPPAAIDSISAFEWVAANTEKLGIDASRLFVGGDSAGGNLAAVVAQQARDKGLHDIRGQVLIYPMVAHFSKNFASYQTKGTGYALTTNTMQWFWNSYLETSTHWKPGQTEHVLATPASVADLSKLPPALLITAENDPLHDEGAEYAEQLRSAGCEVQYTDYPGYAHGFIGVGGPGEEHDKGVAEIVNWLHAQ